ncbi:hypothetical protein ElyMa_003851000 [Elysia marginata]|uniref:Uncharacterized protein n=1 Tax=Elysia marginata TaxID=1093978 RepID=A0AAV4FHL9_9GAST|nr:hypothetical protein ElyMa_003851000 [Elysia marginata]
MSPDNPVLALRKRRVDHLVALNNHCFNHDKSSQLPTRLLADNPMLAFGKMRVDHLNNHCFNHDKSSQLATRMSPDNQPLVPASPALRCQDGLADSHLSRHDMQMSRLQGCWPHLSRRQGLCLQRWLELFNQIFPGNMSCHPLLFALASLNPFYHYYNDV